jgi:hypothetical protein
MPALMQQPAVGEPKARADWIAPLCLMVGTSLLLVAAYVAMHTVRERAWLATRPVPDLPVTDSKYVAAFGMAGLTWTADLDAALRWARHNDRLVFLEIDGITDANGALNHVRVFTDGSVHAALRHYVRVMWYVDMVEEKCYKGPASEDERLEDAQANPSTLTRAKRLGMPSCTRKPTAVSTSWQLMEA